MIQIRNNSVLSTPLSITTTTIVPFDTTVLNTNTNILKFKDNTIQELVPGTYDAECVVVLQNLGSSVVTAELSAYADGSPITGSIVAVSIPATEQATLDLRRILQVVSSNQGIANVSWYISGGELSLVNAYAIVSRVV